MVASGGNIAQVAAELGIYDSTLGNWVRQFREQAEGAPSGEERAEIRDLERELDRVTRERDIRSARLADHTLPRSATARRSPRPT